MSDGTITITSLDYHRNGVSGIGFYVALFDWRDEDTPEGSTGRSMIATVIPFSDYPGSPEWYAEHGFSRAEHDRDKAYYDESIRWYAGGCFVLDVDMAASGDVSFGHNSWRGDHFEGALRRAITDYQNREDRFTNFGPWPAEPRTYSMRTYELV